MYARNDNADRFSLARFGHVNVAGVCAHAAGVITASKVDRIITPKTLKRRTGQMPSTYTDELLSEWLRGTSEPEDGGFKGSYWT